MLLPKLHQIKGSVWISLSSPSTILQPSDSAMEAKAQLTRATPPQFSCLATFAATTRKRRKSTFNAKIWVFWKVMLSLTDKSTPSILNLNHLTHLASSEPRLLHPTMQKTKWYLRTPHRTEELMSNLVPVSISKVQLLHGRVAKSCASKAWLSLRNFSRMPRIKASDDTSALRWKGFSWVGSYCLTMKNCGVLSIAWTAPAIHLFPHSMRGLQRMLSHHHREKLCNYNRDSLPAIQIVSWISLVWHSDSVPIGALAKAQAALPASCLCKQWEDEALLHEDERILYHIYQAG